MKLLEKTLGHAGRLRILYVLSSKQAEGMTKYGLEKTTRLDPIYVRRHLKVLVEIDWVKEYGYYPKVYFLNLENPQVKCLVDFFRNIGSV